MSIEVTVKKWGNSMGIVLPREVVEKEKIKPNQKILVDLVKKADLTKIFGSLKSKLSGQEFKDLVREGWES